ncbi:DUF4328 domain-containing protein [Pseudonocardia sp.]|uniref:DUF4328 domain-containing protein n=1 Tax=Pseudonocardia sp. TaxID=60912 RepID=UPI003D1363A6
MTCARCGYSSPPPAGPFCSHCGAQLSVLRWVAEPPPSTQRPPEPPRPRYTGPPRYPVPQRWGFPPLPWRPPGAGGPPRPDPEHGVAALAVVLVPMLWATAAVAVTAAFAEAWRYGLLLASREGALSAEVVTASDALVAAAGALAPTLGALAGLLLVLWTVRAAPAAAAIAGVRPARTTRMIVAGWLVPGLNLAVPGSVLAETEHAALRRPVGERPRPSRLVLLWWLLWAGGVVFATVVLLWSLREGVQAQADGVVLHALLDLLAAATAAVTAVLVTRFTRLVGPVRVRPREIVVALGSRSATGSAPDTTRDSTCDPAPVGGRDVTPPATPPPEAPAVPA